MSRRTVRRARKVLTVGSLCTGYGGLDLGLLAALGEGRVAWVADSDPDVQSILELRVPGVPNLGDISTIDWSRVDPVDVITFGFPCQDVSSAGKGLGIREGARSGIWHHGVTAIRHLRPAFVVVENVAALRWRQGGLGDLAEIGYDALWTSVRASDIGAPHRRERVFILAFPDQGQADRESRAAASRVAHAHRRRLAFLCTDHGAQVEPCGTADKSDPDRCSSPAAHSSCFGSRCTSSEVEQQLPTTARRASSPPSTDAARDRRHEGFAAPTRFQGRSHARSRRASTSLQEFWAEYAPAIQTWEERTGRPAPTPVEPGKDGRPRLAPAFVEWLMGLPCGWVTDVKLSRVAQLRALGNGVVPQQAERALLALLCLAFPGQSPASVSVAA